MQINKWISLWVGGKLPKVHYSGLRSYKDIREKIKYIYKTFLIHPIKRRIAKYYLIILRYFTNIKVIGITGSAGKTSTKEMLASILKLKGETVYSYANIDPVYNIPDTILKCRFSTKYLILEMGVEYPGEMDFYLWLVKPDIGVITNIYPTHTEFFKDIAGVFREKKKLCVSLNEKCTAILNAGNKLLKNLDNELGSKVVFFGNGTDVMSSKEKLIEGKGMRFLLTISQDPKERIWITIPILGRQFVDNALAASAVSKVLNISLEKIRDGLEKYELPEHRMKLLHHRSGALIIDDTYNNNPQAAIEAIKTLREFSNTRNKIVVFGDMLELGDLSEKYHIKLGKYFTKSGSLELFCIGEFSKKTAEVASKSVGSSRVFYSRTWEDIALRLRAYLKPQVVILVKGSRSLGLEKLVSQIMSMKGVKDDKIVN